MLYANSVYNSFKLSHLFIANSSIDLRVGSDFDIFKWKSDNQNFIRRSDEFAKLYNLPIVYVFSNYMNYVCNLNSLIHLYTHNYITLANVLALKKLWSIFLFSSTHPFTMFSLDNNSSHDTAYYELLSNHVISSKDFLCFSGGIKSNRIQKTLALTSNDIAKKLLHPCFTKDKNCSKDTCSKCLRALLTFDY